MTGMAEGAVVIVTGGASGMGKAICQRFAEEGAKAVIVADMMSTPREGGHTALELIAAHGAAARFVKTDVSRVKDVEAAVAAADEFGGVTVLVASAGILKIHDFLDVAEEDYDRIMAVNAKGVFFSAQIAARSMVTGGREGSIILMSSTGGVRGSRFGVPYCASKGAVKLMTYAMADALGPKGIRVNAIHPGFMDTAMNAGNTLEGFGMSTPLARAGNSVEAANVAVFLASPLASYVTAASYLVDGGITNTS
jgi:NAD(P)-dependent dehydrogenase (short-subunit alcohol dehydrogenase family)